MTWRPLSQHKPTLRVGNHPETFRPALNGNDLNKINDQVAIQISGCPAYVHFLILSKFLNASPQNNADS